MKQAISMDTDITVNREEPNLIASRVTRSSQYSSSAMLHHMRMCSSVLLDPHRFLQMEQDNQDVHSNMIY